MISKKSFTSAVIAFTRVHRSTESTNKTLFLKNASSCRLATSKTLIRYHHALLFTCAFPEDEQLLVMAEKELMRITRYLKSHKKKAILINSGLPYTNYYSSSSHDFSHWLFVHPDCRVTFSEFKNAGTELNDVLSLLLPPVLKSETNAGRTNEELLESLRIRRKDWLNFMLNEFTKINHEPLVKDYLYESLGIYYDVIPKNKYFSLSYNRIPIRKTYFRNQPIPSFEPGEFLNRQVNAPLRLPQPEKLHLIKTIKNSMALTGRETDPVTYMDEKSLRLYELENGVSIAIYGISFERQLALESYVGYTLFVNGFPVAYGGAWLFGPLANFGINIFEAYRGAESKYILCQLLRLYRQVFGVSCFEIEPYQYGLDNPEGIKTGAFWFYYRLGFRPTDKSLRILAQHESRKIKTRRNYRSSKKTLVRFTAGSMLLTLGKQRPLRLAKIIEKTVRLISINYNGNTREAEQASMQRFKELAGMKRVNQRQERVLREISLWAATMEIDDKEDIQLMKQLVQAKPKSLYAFQHLLLSFFNKEKRK